MKTFATAAYILALLALLIIVLATTRVADAKPSSGYTPVCTSITAAAPVLDGQYAGVSCPQGRLTVSVRAGQALPALGAARVLPGAYAGVYDLVAGGERYVISR